MEVASPFPTIYECINSGASTTNVLQRLEHPFTISIKGSHRSIFASVTPSDTVALDPYQTATSSGVWADRLSHSKVRSAWDCSKLWSLIGRIDHRSGVDHAIRRHDRQMDPRTMLNGLMFNPFE